MTTTQDLAKANSRPKGGNHSRLNHNHLKTLKTLLRHQWEQYPPTWFVTIQWSPAPYEYQTISKHARHFRNKLLTYLYSCDLRKLPPPQERCRLIWFHEKALDSNDRFIVHSHLHLTQAPQVHSAHHLQWIIANRIAPGFDCLKNLQSKRNPAVVIRPWNDDHHAFYNLKDYYRYHNHQDGDLVLDYHISDLIGT